MLFRTLRPDTPVGDRFDDAREGFVTRREGETRVVEIACSPERAVELLPRLVDALPSQVDVTLHCARTRRRFRGEARLRAEVTEALRPLLPLLAVSGGVEVSVFGAQDQVSLSYNCDIWVYSATGRWPLVLAGVGVESVDVLTRRMWRVREDEFTGAEVLIRTVEDAANRLTLSEASP